MQKKFGQVFTQQYNNIKVLTLGKVSIKELLQQSNLMVTDYSSVAFDFNYLAKPVIFYHLDLDEYLYHRGSYINLSTDLPGDVVTTPSELIKLIEAYIETDFKYSNAYQSISDKFYKYRDTNHSARIYQQIKALS